MKEVTNLVKKGWAEAMINQGTLSLIMMLDDFLISGPYVANKSQEDELMKNPNVIIINNYKTKEYLVKQMSIYDYDNLPDQNEVVITYYMLRPYIRGILYGLNSLYQLSVYVPSDNPAKMNLYRDIINKIDFGNQFFQDRIYWNLEIMQKDILDRRLACLIYPSSYKNLTNSWFKKISLESCRFEADVQTDLTENAHLFDLVEMRGFLEDMHQRFFSNYHQNKELYFTDMIKKFIASKGVKKSYNNNWISYTCGFYSNSITVTAGTKRFISVIDKPYMSDRFDKERKKATKEKGLKLFRRSDSNKTPSIASNKDEIDNSEFKNLFREYEDIIKEQLRISKQLSQNDLDSKSLNKSLCRWNSITLRKSEILTLLLKQNDKEKISRKISDLNSTYYEDQYKSANSDSELYSTTSNHRHSTASTSSDNCFVVISSEKTDASSSDINDIPRFTTWYTKPVVTA